MRHGGPGPLINGGAWAPGGAWYLVGVLGDDGYYRSRPSAGRMTFDEHDPRAVAAQIAESRGDTPTRAQPGRRQRTVRRDGPGGRLPAPCARRGVGRRGARTVSTRAPADPALGIRHGRGILFGAAVLLRLARSLDESRARTRRAEATFQAALEGSLDAVFILEAVRRPSDGRLVDLRVRDCNERAAQGLGTDRTGCSARPFRSACPSRHGST